MIVRHQQPAGRLLIVNDLERLAPIARSIYSPGPISGVRSFLAGIAEVPRSETKAIIVSHDPACANVEAAIRGLRKVAGDDIPLIFCCEPPYEQLAMRTCDAGANDYVIFPPERSTLRTLILGADATTPAPQTSARAATTGFQGATTGELLRISNALHNVTRRSPEAMTSLAEMICFAFDARAAEIRIANRIGRFGSETLTDENTVMSEPLGPRAKPIGQIRVGASGRGGYHKNDPERLRHYGLLVFRLLENATRQTHWRRLALTDDLTGLPNRRSLMSTLTDKLEAARRIGETLTVLIFDIDDFKRYNDAYGHDAGDEILREVGKLFIACSRKGDVVARYGGDEFVVVFDAEQPRAEGSQHPRRVYDLVKRFKKALDQHTFSRLGPEATGYLTISGGLASFPAQGDQPAQLLEAADQALLKAKEGGKSRFYVVGGGEVDCGD